MQKYLFIAVGGALGAVARYWLGAAVTNRLGARFPYGTFVINITACVVIGFSLTLLNRRTGMNPAWRYLIPIGFVGAYSTFSTFEWEIYGNLQAGTFFSAGLYTVLSLVLGLVGVWCGVLVSNMVP